MCGNGGFSVDFIHQRKSKMRLTAAFDPLRSGLVFWGRRAPAAQSLCLVIMAKQLTCTGSDTSVQLAGQSTTAGKT